MASGNSGRVNSGSESFDFASDDILCSYEDYATQDASNGTHGDSVLAANHSKDFHKSRMTRTSVFPSSPYNQPEDSLVQEVSSAVEKSMKKQTDNIMRFLEGLSSRLSQLELYCYNLDKSIAEMRSDLNRDHKESESKLKFLEKHVQEVHKSVQIIRDKQELAETQKELAKLQLAQKDSSSSSHPQSNEERASHPTPDSKKPDTQPEQQLALALPHQVAPQLPVAPPSQATAQNTAQVNQQQPYYMSPTAMPNLPPVTQLPQNQYMPSDSQYRTPQVQDLSRVGAQSVTSQVTQAPPVQPFHQYQQQLWPQQLPQQMQPPQQSSMQPPMRSASPISYPTYPQPQPTNPPPQETAPSSMPMQMSYTGIPPTGSSRADTLPYGYSGSGRAVVQQPPPQPTKPSFSAPPGDMYGNIGTHTALPPGSAYMIYESDGRRTQHPPQPSLFAQGGYPPPSGSIQNPQASHNPTVRNPSQAQFYRGHPYNELIEKLVNMGFRGDHVAMVIQRMEESGQPVDFNSVLDRLNAPPSVGPKRPWSG